MNINLLSILIIRMDLIFRVSFALFTNNSLLNNIIDPSKKRGEGVLRRAINNKSQSSQLITAIDIHQ